MSSKKEIFPHREDCLKLSDIHRLTPHMAGYNKLAKILTLGTLTEKDLESMILMEVYMRKKGPRQNVVDKLVGRLMTIQREKLKTTIDAVCEIQNRKRARNKK